MIAIVDCNSFYCSCERLFRPPLLEHPVVVLSNNDGCIVSRSDEAKALGIPMAGPYFESRDLMQMHDVAVFSSNYNLYGDLSMRVMDSLRHVAGEENVEVYSVDEAFVNLPEMPIASLDAAARELRHTVEQWTGISVSVGVAPTKTLAKLANYLAKKNKQASGCVTVLATAAQQKEALQQTRLENIWGVGRAYARKLYEVGITNGWELMHQPEAWINHQLGGVNGLRLLRELRGEPAIGLKEELVQKKMIATTRMFGYPVSDLVSIKEALATYTSRAAEKLRRQHSAAGEIGVFMVKKDEDHLTDFYHGSTLRRQMRLPTPTSATQLLIKPALEMAEELFECGHSYKKAGVLLSGLVPDTSRQGNLFAEETTNCTPRLMEMIDNINFSQRDDILKFASSGTRRDWKMRQEKRSPRYTTRWDELCEVR